jgi:hypothetical protein
MAKKVDSARIHTYARDAYEFWAIVEFRDSKALAIVHCRGELIATAEKPATITPVWAGGG